MKNFFNIAKLIFPGALLAFALALVITFLSTSLSKFSNFFLDPLFIGLLSGLCVRWILGDWFLFWPGFGFVQDFFIPLGILLYATQVRWNVFSITAAQQFFIPIALAFFIYYLFLVRTRQRLKVRKQASLLFWASCALLGPIAVVLLAPTLETTDEETSLSLIMAAFATILMLILLPIITHVFSFGLFTTGTLSTLVLPLLSPVNPVTIGSLEAIQSATLLFGIKIALLGPIALIIYFGNKTAARNREILPLIYIAGFMIIGTLFTFVPSLHFVAAKLLPYSHFALTLAMAAVGLSTNLRRLISQQSKTVATYLLLAGCAGLTAFVVDTLTIHYFLGGL